MLVGQPRGQPDRASRSSSPRRSTRSGSDLLALINDILDLSQDRVGHDDGRRRRRAASPDLRDYVERTFRHVAEQQGASTSTIELDAGLPRAMQHRRQAAAAGAEEPALQRLQVHREGRGRACASGRPRSGLEPGARRSSTARDAVVAFAVTDTGIGIAARQAADHLRGLPAGRRHHQPQVRRHRASACRSAARSPACSAARSSCDERARQGQHVHPLPAARPTRRASRARRARRAGQRPPIAPPPRAVPAPLAAAGEPAAHAARGAGRPRDRRLTSERRGRPRRHPARRPRAPDRRGRPRLRRASCCDLAREQGFKALVAGRARDGAGAWRASFKPDAITLDLQPARHGRLDGARPAQARRRAPATSRSTSSRSRTSRQRGAAAGRARPTCRSRSTSDALERAPSAASRASSSGRCKKLLVVEDDEVQRKQHRRADRQRRRADHRGRHRRGGAGGAATSEHFDCMVLDLRPARHDAASSCSSRSRSEPQLRDAAHRRLHRART